jgi:Arc/MetJ-type ribon-helix-helix transcriptional regulator
MTVRVPLELRQEALRVARGRGETLSDIVRDALREYVRRYGNGV